MYLAGYGTFPTDSLTMSSTLQHNDQSNTVKKSSSVEHCYVQDHRPTAATSVDHINIGPTMQHRIERPLSTYTSLGSPIHRPNTGLFIAPRKMSVGNGTPSSPLLSSVTGRSRSNSLVGGVPSLLLPSQQFMYDDVARVHPIVDGNMLSSETIQVTQNVATTSHNESNAYKKLTAETKTQLELEKGDESMSCEELRLELKRERARVAKIQADLELTQSKYNKLLSYCQQLEDHGTRDPSDSNRTEQVLLMRKKRKLDLVECSKSH